MRNGVLPVVVIVAVLLFLTRPATYTRWVALLTAVTTLGGGMTQLLGLFQTQRRQGTS